MPNRYAFVNVTSLAVLSHASNAPAGLGSAAVAVTSRGLAVLRFEMWTLAEKAEHFQTFLTQPDRHEKFSLVATCSMSSWGDSRTSIKGPVDSDALWTSMYMNSQIFRYKVTQDAAVKATAWKNFEAFNVLNQVTGILGYSARSFVKRTDFPPQPNWYAYTLLLNLNIHILTHDWYLIGENYTHTKWGI